MWMILRTGTTVASMSVFQSPLMPGKGSNSLDDVFCFDALSHIASVKPFGLGMEMKKIRCEA
jgi:hypothetical protein